MQNVSYFRYAVEIDNSSKTQQKHAVIITTCWKTLRLIFAVVGNFTQSNRRIIVAMDTIDKYLMAIFVVKVIVVLLLVLVTVAAVTFHMMLMEHSNVCVIRCITSKKWFVECY